MAKQEFTIRINRKGQIFVEFEGMPVREVKDLVKFFEETLGPTEQVIGGDGDAAGSVEIDEMFAHGEDTAKEAEKTRERLRGD
ncbi:hypothetical protein BH09SUM1_BH09SUM1_05820 [soil metagenome]